MAAPVVIIVGMAGYALGRVRVQQYVAQRGLPAEELNDLRCFLMGVTSLLALLTYAACMPASSERALLLSLHTVGRGQWGLIGLSCFLSAFAGSHLQFQGQRLVSAANGQSVFALSPLFAAGWSRLLLDEPIEPITRIAGAIGVGGALVASTDRNASAAKPARPGLRGAGTADEAIG
jgi:drug/metabolite transporter (DMT)-like permease